MRPAEFEIREGEALARLREMPARSVQTIVTSPPYYSLRDYGHPDQLGAERTVEEYIERLVRIFDEARRVLRDDGTLWLNIGDSYCGTDTRDTFPLSRENAAWLAALIDGEGCVQAHRQVREGSVPSFQVDVGVGMVDEAMVRRAHEITGLGSLNQQARGVWDWSVRGQQAARLLRAIYPWLVLKRDRSALAIMLAKDVAERRGNRVRPITDEVVAYRDELKQAIADCNQRRVPRVTPEPPAPLPLGLKGKDLTGVPWRVAFALQDAGWWLRKDIIWTKPNPTPEAVRDRPTSSHEHVFLFSKAASYFYDVDGYREPSVSTTPAGNGFKREHRISGGLAGGSDEKWQLQETRQLRDVWTIPTLPYAGAHFAVFPPELPRRCILLGTSPRACDRCRAPFRRRVERKRLLDGEPIAGSWNTDKRPEASRIKADGIGHGRFTSERRTLGWVPTCACGAPPGVLDGDLDEIDSPNGQDLEADPSLLVGRGGLARPRGQDAGVRTMLRYEQRMIARQLAGSPHRQAMEAEAGSEAFAHYMRTDRSGARPPRPEMLDAWVERGWVQRVEAPEPWWDPEGSERCIVLDPFAGAGTTGLVAVDEGRDFLGIELHAGYADMARRRILERAQAPRFEFLA